MDGLRWMPMFLDIAPVTPTEKATSLVGPMLFAAACLVIAVFLFLWLRKRKK